MELAKRHAARSLELDDVALAADALRDAPAVFYWRFIGDVFSQRVEVTLPALEAEEVILVEFGAFYVVFICDRYRVELAVQQPDKNNLHAPNLLAEVEGLPAVCALVPRVALLENVEVS